MAGDRALCRRMLDLAVGATDVQAMSKVASLVTGKPYGLAAVCRAWRIARSGVYRHRTPPSSAPRRRGPMGALSDAALTAAIKAVLAASPWRGPSQGVGAVA